jgi:tripartite-type tricarboxylate transporter receptor subunit TctC
MTLRLLVLICGFAALHALAQPFPSKPIRLLTGYPPGGSADFLSRVAADELSR